MAGHGPSPDPRGQWPSPWGTRISCTAWRSDCSPSRICSTCSDSSITWDVGVRGHQVSGPPISASLFFPPCSHLSHPPPAVACPVCLCFLPHWAPRGR